MKLFACNERARAIVLARQCLFIEALASHWHHSHHPADARRGMDGEHRLIAIPQNKTDQRDTSNRFICTERPDVSTLSLILYITTMFGPWTAFGYAIYYVWCLTLSLQLCERASLMWRLGCHTFAHLFTISTCGMGLLGWIPRERPGRKPGEEIMIHTNCMKNFHVLKWMINLTNGFSSQF